MTNIVDILLGRTPASPGQPALSQDPNNANQQTPVLQGATGNARGSSRMPMIPNNRIDMGTEGLMRIGGSMISGARDGALSAYSAGMDAYGGIQDYNRQADMERMKIEEARMLEEQRRQDLLRKLNAAKKEDEPKKADDTEIARLEGLLNDLKTDPNMTGPVAGRAQQALDRSGLGNPKRAAKRLILSELQVNATLAYTAQTKGAITDREMALFQTPVPKLTDDEQVWIAWLEPQLEILKQLQQNGITDEAAAQQGITPSTSGSTSQPTVDDLVNQYDPQN
jgi:hypothetical protein